MNALLLAFVIIGVTLQQVCKKAYNIRVSGATYSFLAASTFFSIIFFLITGSGSIALSAKAFAYSLAFALAYGIATVGSMLAISTGPLSLTSLIVQYSLVIPTFFGLIALNEPIDFSLVCGILLLLISLLFINREKSGEEKKITLKWGIYAFMAFVGNGTCSTVQKMQQISCNGMYKNEFMIVSLSITVLYLMIFAGFTEKQEIGLHLKKGVLWYIICGLANGVVNFLVLVLSTRMPASMMFPIISAGGIITTGLISVLGYKETFSLSQKIGFFLGITAVVVLNI